MMGNECFMITIYVFLFAVRLKDYSMNIQDLSNLYLFLLFRDYLVVGANMMGNECFMITIYVILFAVRLKDYSIMYILLELSYYQC